MSDARQELTSEQVQEILVDKIREKRLTIVGVDGLGNKVTWGDPALVGVRLYGPGGLYYYRVRALLRETGASDELIKEVEDEIIANGRRHWMKGELDGDRRSVS